MKIYGHYASQPARSVLWLLKMNKIPFEFIKVEPLAGGAKKPAFISKFPTAMVPTLEYDGFYLAESSAIMQYICEKHELDQWWSLKPGYIKPRAKINEYLSYHHGSTRRISRLLAYPVFQQKFFKKQWDPVEKEKALEEGHKVLADFERIFLKSDNTFVQGFQLPTIADLYAYPEISQLHHLKVLTVDEKYPRLSQWLTNMAKLPEHDDIHQTVIKIATLTAYMETPTETCDVPEDKKKPLVVFFSRTNNTRTVATSLSSKLHCDTVEIIEKSPPKGFFRNPISAFQALFKKEPEIELSAPKDLSNYSHIIIGTPIWASSLSGPVRAFLSKKLPKHVSYSIFFTYGGLHFPTMNKKIADVSNSIVDKPPTVVVDISAQNVEVSEVVDAKLKEFDFLTPK